MITDGQRCPRKHKKVGSRTQLISFFSKRAAWKEGIVGPHSDIAPDGVPSEGG